MITAGTPFNLFQLSYLSVPGYHCFPVPAHVACISASSHLNTMLLTDDTRDSLQLGYRRSAPRGAGIKSNYRSVWILHKHESYCRPQLNMLVYSRHMYPHLFFGSHAQYARTAPHSELYVLDSFVPSRFTSPIIPVTFTQLACALMLTSSLRGFGVRCTTLPEGQLGFSNT